MPRSLPGSPFAMILSLVLTAVLAACGGDGGSDGTPSAEPSPSVAATPSPTAADRMPGDGEGLNAADVVEELRPSVVHILSEAATLDVLGR